MSDDDDSTASPSSSVHPFRNTASKLVVLRDHIDIEEESRLFDQICEGTDFARAPRHPKHRGRSSTPPSVFSRESESIWLADHRGESSGAFSRNVTIRGWTSVGEPRGGAYVVYDCAIQSKEGPVIHAHKRYSAFEELYTALRRTLPRDQLPYVPNLPPKSPLAEFRPVFLDRRRRQLERWLAAVLLHPDVGASKVVKQWVIG